MRVVFMGTPQFAVPPLEHLTLSQHEVVAVYTAPDKPAGRGRSLLPSPVKKAALALNLPVVQPVSLRPAEAVAQLADFHPEVIVVAAYGKLLPQSVLDIPRYGCLNIHPSLLPRYRGAAPIPAAILVGDAFTGVSIMLLDKGMDTGPVLTRAQIPIASLDTTGLLTTKLSQIGARLTPEALLFWSRGELTPQPQNEAGATHSVPVTKEQGEIDWRLPAIDIWRRVRAFQPWPGAYTRWRGKRLELITAIPLTGVQAQEPGRVIRLSTKTDGAQAGFGVATGDGVLGVVRVQAEGKLAMSAADFIRGQPQLIGEILPTGG